MKCSCIPGRFICGEDGSVGEALPSLYSLSPNHEPPDIGDFLKDEIKGPATFSCTTGGGCKFEEPAMNGLILSIFGDGYISLECEGGECLHYSQVPGYIVSISRCYYLSIPDKFLISVCSSCCRGHRNRIIPHGLR